MPDQFWSLTWADYYRLCEAERLRTQRQWEQTRYIACTILNVNSTKLIKPSDLMHLHLIDKENKVESSEPVKTHYSKEEMSEIVKRFRINGKHS